MAKIDGLEIVMTKHIKSEIDKELKKRFEELKLELATRYEELLNMRNMEADQFNDGFNDARAGKIETDHPHYDLDTDNWRLGYAYGMFEPMKEKLARELIGMTPQPAFPAWIPVSERLPDNWKPVMTIDMSESTRVPVPAFYDPETSLWSTHLPNCDLWVTHWMPLPELPKEREE